MIIITEQFKMKKENKIKPNRTWMKIKDEVNKT